MQTITLKDNYFRVIGYVEIKDNGDKVLKDDVYRVKGYYDAQKNITQDSYFRMVGYGDILTTLL